MICGRTNQNRLAANNEIIGYSKRTITGQHRSAISGTEMMAVVEGWRAKYRVMGFETRDAQQEPTSRGHNDGF